MKLAGQRVLILGATSAVARELARLVVEQGCPVALVARNAAHLNAVARDLRTRGGTVVCLECDLGRTETHEALLGEAWRSLGGVDIALIAYGLYAERGAAEDSALLQTLLHTNFVSAAHLASQLAGRFVKQGSGCVAAITSVAGVRGRKRNFVYGSAKAGLSVFLQGLDHKLARGPVRILDIRMGLVASPMTAHLPPSPLMISAQRAAVLILAAMGKERAVVYVPGFWRWIAAILRAAPRRLMNGIDI